MEGMQTITATWARTHFGEIVRKAVSVGERFLVERDSIPAVVILSVSEYEHLRRQADLGRFYELSRQAGLDMEDEGLTETDIQAELQVIKEQVYTERYGRG